MPSQDIRAAAYITAYMKSYHYASHVLFTFDTPCRYEFTLYVAMLPAPLRRAFIEYAGAKSDADATL